MICSLGRHFNDESIDVHSDWLETAILKNKEHRINLNTVSMAMCFYLQLNRNNLERFFTISKEIRHHLGESDSRLSAISADNEFNIEEKFIGKYLHSFLLSFEVLLAELDSAIAIIDSRSPFTL